MTRAAKPLWGVTSSVAAIVYSSGSVNTIGDILIKYAPKFTTHRSANESIVCSDSRLRDLDSRPCQSHAICATPGLVILLNVVVLLGLRATNRDGLTMA